MGKRGSGLTHIRYGHVTRPTELALVCPRCGALAVARQPVHAVRSYVGDCSPEWAQPWSIVGTVWTSRATELDWKTMRMAPWTDDTGGRIASRARSLRSACGEDGSSIDGLATTAAR
jgi:hypothetical protein